MGLRGPPPKPNAIKVLEGNPGNKRLNPAEPKPQKITQVSPPEHFSGDAAKVWDLVTKELSRLNLLTILDLEALSRYVDYLMEYRTARDKIRGELVIPYFEADKKTLRYLQINPLITIRNQAADKLLKLEQQFGMSPSARARMIAMVDGWKGGGGDYDDDPFAP